jgi:hypothetical protein
MVRNFGILKITLFIPILSDQCNTGPLEVNFTITATISIGMQRILSRIVDATMSKIRLFFTLYIAFLFYLAADKGG